MKSLMPVAFFLITFVAVAETPVIQITNVHAQQRYPWNGKVDISFTLTGEPNDSGMLTIFATDTSCGKRLALHAITLDGVDHRAVFGHPDYGDQAKYPIPQLNGTHTIVWDSPVDYPADYRDAKNTQMIYEISIQRAKRKVEDALGEANGIIGDVLAVNLAALMEARAITDSIATYQAVDLGTFNCDTYKTTKMTFVKIRSGAYVVGTGETASSPVTLTKDYWKGMHQVTRQQYYNVMQTDPSEAFSSEGMLAPVQNVSWTAITQAGGFLAKVNEKIQAAGGTFQIQLPTEAQWEIAARAGTTTQWFFGATDAQLGNYAWCCVNYTGVSHTVGTKLANPWGLYDVYGNKWEWCQDVYGYAYPSTAQDPTGASPASNHVICGGNCSTATSSCRSDYRNSNPSDAAGAHLGFRAALVISNL